MATLQMGFLCHCQTAEESWDFLNHHVCILRSQKLKAEGNRHQKLNASVKSLGMDYVGTFSCCGPLTSQMAYGCGLGGLRMGLGWPADVAWMACGCGLGGLRMWLGVEDLVQTHIAQLLTVESVHHVVMSPCLFHDTRILRDSLFWKAVQGLILGGCVHPIQEWLMALFAQPINRRQEGFISPKSTQATVERFTRVAKQC
ncbi:hypothetical protein PoB_004259500 [Plakobranchus ocellatus]|uniref:Uncharacterized protein n=1 Tax=Plakobranchus ocellatus TaxID=259542 RepID=A0AAV4B684_9GAST|nr:hypothetical protein PoB_004259500 [Plakobranchus ocellatus]